MITEISAWLGSETNAYNEPNSAQVMCHSGGTNIHLTPAHWVTSRKLGAPNQGTPDLGTPDLDICAPHVSLQILGRWYRSKISLGRGSEVGQWLQWLLLNSLLIYLGPWHWTWFARVHKAWQWGIHKEQIYWANHSGNGILVETIWCGCFCCKASGKALRL